MNRPFILVLSGILSISIGVNILCLSHISQQQKIMTEIKAILIEKREQKRKEYMDKIIEHILESYDRKCII
jgi:hypothetical protein